MANQARGDACRSRLAEKLSAQTVAVQADGDPLAGPVHDALATLGSRDREILLLAEWEGLTPAEIARVMRCPAVSVRVRLHRARRRFRALFESQTEETTPLPRSRLCMPRRIRAVMVAWCSPEPDRISKE